MQNSALADLTIRAILTTASKLAAFVSPLFVDLNKVNRAIDIPYGTHGNKLDAFTPKGRKAENLPITLLIHGGGFGFFSKESHAAAASMSAQNGQLTFTIDYRLTPAHRYPAGLVDTIEAYHWILENAESHGGDLTKISIVGESAGANYALALCLYLSGLAALDETSLPQKPTVYPKKAVIHCGFLEITHPERLKQDPRCSSIAVSRMVHIQKNYIPESVGHDDEDFGLANPLLVMEKLAQAGVKLPPTFPEVFVPVGEEDPVIGDSERLALALEKLGQKARLKIYPGAGHAFYAFIYRESAKAVWKDIDQILRRGQS